MDIINNIAFYCRIWWHCIGLIFEDVDIVVLMLPRIVARYSLHFSSSSIMLISDQLYGIVCMHCIQPSMVTWPILSSNMKRGRLILKYIIL